MTNPNISFRDDPTVIEALKEELGEGETASAVRAAIRHTLYCKDRSCEHLQIVQTTQINLHDFYTIESASKLLGRSFSTVWRWVKNNKIKYIERGERGYLIPKEEIEKRLTPVVTQA